MPKLRQTVNATLVKTVTADLASIDSILSITTSITVPGAKAGNMYLVAMANADLNAGLVIQNPIFCEVDGTLLVRVINATAGALNPGAADMHVIGL
jgi:hypothetical protein